MWAVDVFSQQTESGRVFDNLIRFNWKTKQQKIKCLVRGISVNPRSSKEVDSILSNVEKKNKMTETIDHMLWTFK